MLAVAALTLAGLVAGCGSDDDSDSGDSGDSGSAPISQFAIVAPEKGNDYGWNQQGVEAAEKVAADLGIDVDVADNSGYEDISPVLRELSTSGNEFIVAQASGYNTTAPDVAGADRRPGARRGTTRRRTCPETSANAGTASQEGAYLAGVLAAKTSKSGNLGIVISADDTNWNKQAGGFVAGARSENPDVEIELAQIGQAGYADTAGGKRVTEAVIADGADVVFGMGDGVVVRDAAGGRGGRRRSWFIDVIGDKTRDRRPGRAALVGAVGLRRPLQGRDRRHRRRHLRRGGLRARPRERWDLAAPDRPASPSDAGASSRTPSRRSSTATSRCR